MHAGVQVLALSVFEGACLAKLFEAVVNLDFFPVLYKQLIVSRCECGTYTSDELIGVSKLTEVFDVLKVFENTILRDTARVSAEVL